MPAGEEEGRGGEGGVTGEEEGGGGGVTGGLTRQRQEVDMSQFRPISDVDELELELECLENKADAEPAEQQQQQPSQRSAEEEEVS